MEITIGQREVYDVLGWKRDAFALYLVASEDLDRASPYMYSISRLIKPLGEIVDSRKGQVLTEAVQRTTIFLSFLSQAMNRMHHFLLGLS